MHKRKKPSTSRIEVGLIVNVASKVCRDIQLAVARASLSDSDVSVRTFLGGAATTLENLVDFAKSGLDGLLMIGFPHQLAVDLINSGEGIPPVVLGSYAPLSSEARSQLGRCACFSFDNEGLGVMAAQFLLSHGLTNFAFVESGVRRESEDAELRFQAFRRTVEEKGGASCTVSRFSLGRSWANGDFCSSGRAYIEDWFKTLKPPCGVFVNGELEAVRLLKVCCELGIDVPGEVEILGVDNAFGCCDLVSPALSRIRADFDVALALAWKMLRRLIAGHDVSRLEAGAFIRPVQVVERGSTASGRGYGLVADRVKEFVRVHACEGIGVDDVVQALGLSRRIVEKRVREATGQSVLQLIHSVRLAEVRRLLELTDESISEITMKAGYQMTSNLSVLFKRVYGMSMRQWRETHSIPPPPTTTANR